MIATVQEIFSFKSNSNPNAQFTRTAQSPTQGPSKDNPPTYRTMMKTEFSEACHIPICHVRSARNSWPAVSNHNPLVTVYVPILPHRRNERILQPLTKVLLDIPMKFLMRRSVAQQRAVHMRFSDVEDHLFFVMGYALFDVIDASSG